MGGFREGLNFLASAGGLPSRMAGRDQARQFLGDKNYFWGYTNHRMRVSFDQGKRDRTLKDRGLAFEDAVEVFDGPTLDRVDDRRDYGETRVITVGHLRGRLVIVVWTQRVDARHVISMRKANEREKAHWDRYWQRSEEG